MYRELAASFILVRALGLRVNRGELTKGVKDFMQAAYIAFMALT